MEQRKTPIDVAQSVGHTLINFMYNLQSYKALLGNKKLLLYIQKVFFPNYNKYKSPQSCPHEKSEVKKTNKLEKLRLEILNISFSDRYIRNISAGTKKVVI